MQQQQGIKAFIDGLPDLENTQRLQTRLAIAKIDIDLTELPISKVPEAFREAMAKLLALPISQLNPEQIRAITKEVQEAALIPQKVIKGEWETIRVPQTIKGFELRVRSTSRGKEIDISITRADVIDLLNDACEKVHGRSVFGDNLDFRGETSLCMNLPQLLAHKRICEKFVVGWSNDYGMPIVIHTNQHRTGQLRGNFVGPYIPPGLGRIPVELRSLVVAACAGYRFAKGYVNFNGRKLQEEEIGSKEDAGSLFGGMNIKYPRGFFDLSHYSSFLNKPTGLAVYRTSEVDKH